MSEPLFELCSLAVTALPEYAVDMQAAVEGARRRLLPDSSSDPGRGPAPAAQEEATACLPLIGASQAWQGLLQHLGPRWQAAVQELDALLQQPREGLDLVSVRLHGGKVGPRLAGLKPALWVLAIQTATGRSSCNNAAATSAASKHVK